MIKRWNWGAGGAFLMVAVVCCGATGVEAQQVRVRGRGPTVGVQVGAPLVRVRGRRPPPQGRPSIRPPHPMPPPIVAPPPGRVEVHGRPPRQGQVWTPGYWRWNGQRHVWGAGRWQRPQQVGWVWQAPQWTLQNGVWIFVEGQWVAPGVEVVVQPPPVTVVPVRPPPPVLVQPAPPPPVVVQPGPPYGPVEEYAEVRTPPVRAGIGDARGQPTHFERGRHAAYWIWVTPDGVWHLRMPTGGRDARFQGRIVGDGGAVVQLVAVTRAELADRVVQRRRAVHFDLTAQGGFDGLDFRAENNACVRFRLRLDGEDELKRVFLGAQGVPAPSDHFIACP